MIIYSLIAYSNLETPIDALNQRQGNLIKSQDYIYADTESFKQVILGSSMAYRIKKESLPTEFFNLSLGGHNASIGLEIINKLEELPETVFIEMNTIMRETDSGFIDDLFASPSYDMKKNVVITRDKFQPVSFVINKLNQIVAPKNNAIPTQDVKLDETIMRKRLDLQEAFYAEVPEAAAFKKVFDQLKSQILRLGKKNVCIVFFEMPMHSKLCESAFSKKLRKTFFNHFSPEEYPYILISDCKEYHTRDGVHLSPFSADKFGKHLVASFNEISCSK